MKETFRVDVTFLTVRSAAACGALAGLAVSLLPVLLLVANGVVQWADSTLGHDRNSILGAVALRKHLGMAGGYLAAGWPVLIAVVVASGLIALLNRYFYRKGLYFRLVVPDSTMAVSFAWDMPIVVALTPVALMAAAPAVARVLTWTGGLIVFSGAAFYALWELAYWFFVTRLGSVDRTAYVEFTLNETLKTSPTLGACRLEGSVDEAGTARLTGTVPSWDSLSAVRSCALKVQGVLDVDMSDVRVEDSVPYRFGKK